MITSYNADVLRRCREGIAALGQPPFGAHATQTQLLDQVIEKMARHVRDAPLSNPLALLALVMGAWDVPAGSEAVAVGAYGLFYIAAVDLLDDVQDDDLAGTPHDEAGAPVAINSGITLLALASSCLRAAIERADGERGIELLRLFDETGRRAAVGQHRDLLGSAGARSVEEVIAMHAAKTSSIGMMMECGALLADRPRPQREAYARIGSHLAVAVQIVDDVRDIFGKEESPDLEARRWTIPVACLDELSDDGQDVFETLSELGSTDAIREHLYASGAIERCAEELASHRVAIHEAVAALDNAHGAHRLILQTIDELCGTLFEATPLDITHAVMHPQHGAHATMHEESRRFAERMAPHGCPELPTLRPWHQPTYLYVPEHRAIYYPDLEDFAEEIVRFQAALLGGDESPSDLKAIMLRQVPAVMAHELFHHWRQVSGALTDDVWHEEYAANALAVAYTREHAPDALDSALSLGARVIAEHAELLDDHADETLRRCRSYAGSRGYEMPELTMAVVQLTMVRQLASEPATLEQRIAELLSPA